MKEHNKKVAIHGSKKGGGGRTFSEEENTLQSSQTVRSLLAVGEGEIVGLVDGAKSIYLNNVALRNTDGSYNFGGKIEWDQRVGLPSQPPMAGFPAASAEVVVNSEVTAAAPQTRTTSSGIVDAMRVTIGFPQGLYEQRTDTNQLTGSRVSVAIDKKLTSSGTWTTDREVTFDGKTTSPYADSYRVERPEGTGAWDVRLRRLTEDSASATLKNNTYWASYTEIQDVKLEYENTAYMGVAIDARDLGSSSIPVLSFEVKGLIVQVPSNYDPITRVYSGFWDGTFKMAWTDNPAWHLYDMLTHPRYGLGYRITEERVDKYSFYSAAVYNDELVPNGKGGMEPRFTCNVPIQSRDEALRVAQNIASVMRAKIVWMGGQIALIQDRPGSSVRPITAANVLDGMFEYVGSALSERHTAVNVTWNDPSDNYQQRVSSVEATAEEIARYGYNVRQETAFGATSEGQALRYGKWVLDSVLQQTEFVKFKMSLNGFDLTVGDIVTVYDNHYTGEATAGRLGAGSTTTTIKLDRAVNIKAGSRVELLTVAGPVTRNVDVTASGTSPTDTLVLTEPLEVAPGEHTDYIVITNVEPRLFRISKITQSAPNIVDVEALFYDENKYSRVDYNSPPIAPPVYSVVPDSITTAPEDLTISESATFTESAVKRSVLVGWSKPSRGLAVSYYIEYRMAGEAWQVAEPQINHFEVKDVIEGLFECRVYAISHTGFKSSPVVGSYMVNTAETQGSDLPAVTDLKVVNYNQTHGPYAFHGRDLHFDWLFPVEAGTKPIGIKDFLIKISDAETGLLRRKFYAFPVKPGERQNYVYLHTYNGIDGLNGALARSLIVEVRARDANNKLSVAETQTFTNPVPVTPTNVIADGGYGTIFLRWDEAWDVDYNGTLVWASTDPNFTPSKATLVDDLRSSFTSISGLADGTTYYIRVAHYDSFGKSYTGAGLNVSNPIQVKTAKGFGVANGSELPATGEEGELFFLTTNGKLYRYFNGAWTAEVPALDISGLITNAQIAGLEAEKITGQITSTQITDDAITAPKIMGGSITAAKMVTGTITAASGVIADAAIGSAQIQDLAVTNAKVAELSADKITAGFLEAARIETNSLGADKITAGTITADRMQANIMQADNVLTRGLQVRDLDGNIILGAGTGLPSSYVTADAGWLNSNLSLTGANGTLSLTGGGGGSATGIVMPGNPINAANISTYIAGAAIGSAQIGEAAIGTAHIGNLAVKSAQIDDLTVGTNKITGAAISESWSSSTMSDATSVNINIPAGSQALAVFAFFSGFTRVRGSGDNEWIEMASYKGDLSCTGNLFTPTIGYGSAGAQRSSPPAGTYTITAVRDPNGYGAVADGALVLVVLLTKK